VLADFISRWRAENTKRLSIRTSAEVEREKSRTNAALERERMQAQLALEVLKLLPKRAQGPIAERISEVFAFAVEPTLTELEGVATVSRVLGAEVVDPGATLVVSKEPTVGRKHFPFGLAVVLANSSGESVNVCEPDGCQMPVGTAR
jgi:hypothetical protein